MAFIPRSIGRHGYSSALDLLSVWAVLYVLYSESAPPRRKLYGTCIILVCASYFFLNITFTNAAALADFAGLCLILASIRPTNSIRKTPILGGIALIVVGSLIRVQMLLLTLPHPRRVLIPPSIHKSADTARRACYHRLNYFCGLCIRSAICPRPTGLECLLSLQQFGGKDRDAHRLENAGFTD